MKLAKLIVITAIGILSLQSCKKGENDPFLSLKTRDARITGEWELTYSNQTYTYTEAYMGDTYVESEEFLFENGQAQEMGSYTLTQNGVLQSQEYNEDPYNYSEKMNIEKNGICSFNTDSDGSLYSNKGDWKWFDTSKKKTMIVIQGMIYTIDRLTNKELVLLAEEFESSKYTEDGEEYLESYSIERRYKKK